MSMDSQKIEQLARSVIPKSPDFTLVGLEDFGTRYMVGFEDVASSVRISVSFDKSRLNEQLPAKIENCTSLW